MISGLIYQMISGLIYKEEALTLEQDAALIHFLDTKGIWIPLSDSPNSRRVQHYGFRYNYRSGSTTTVTTPIPPLWVEWLNPLDDKKEKEQEQEPIKWNQVIVNEYQAGQWIHWPMATRLCAIHLDQGRPCVLLIL